MPATAQVRFDKLISSDLDKHGNPQGVRLHGLRDSLLGSALTPRLQWNAAIELQNRFSRTALLELVPQTTPQSWSLESCETADETSLFRAG